MENAHRGQKVGLKSDLKALPFVTTWVSLEDILLSKINQAQKDKYHMMSLTCGI